MSAIVARELTKRYGKTRGIDGLDIEVERGEVFGFLGPNGKERQPRSDCCST